MQKLLGKSVSVILAFYCKCIASYHAKELFKGSDLANATFKTIQNKIIKTAARIKEMKTKIRIEFFGFCSSRNLQANSFQTIDPKNLADPSSQLLHIPLKNDLSYGQAVLCLVNCRWKYYLMGTLYPKCIPE